MKKFQSESFSKDNRSLTEVMDQSEGNQNGNEEGDGVDGERDGDGGSTVELDDEVEMEGGEEFKVKEEVDDDDEESDVDNNL